MKARRSAKSAGLVIFALSLAAVGVELGCSKDNSVGGDTVTGEGGSTGSGQGQGGQTASPGTGGSSSPVGAGGTGAITGAAGTTGDGGSGVGATGGSPTGGGSGGTSGLGGTPATGLGGATTGAGGATGAAGTTGAAGKGAGGATSTGKGGSTGAAGTTGGGGTGAVVIMAGGASKCAATTAAMGMLCDGFEGPAIGAAGSVWKSAAGTGSMVVVDTTKPYRGANSVHIKTSGGQGLFTETSTFNQAGTVATNNNMWGRLFIWFSQTGNPQSHDVFITLEDPTSGLMSSQYHEAGGSRGLLNTGLRFGTPASDHYQPAMGTGTVNFDTQTPAWHCWEWHTTSANTSDFYIDGTLYAAMSVTAAMNWPLPVFRSMSLGFMQFSSTPATELWIDEVAIDASATPARIGCDN